MKNQKAYIVENTGFTNLGARRRVQTKLHSSTTQNISGGTERIHYIRSTALGSERKYHTNHRVLYHNVLQHTTHIMLQYTNHDSLSSLILFPLSSLPPCSLVAEWRPTRRPLKATRSNDDVREDRATPLTQCDQTLLSNTFPQFSHHRD